MAIKDFLKALSLSFLKYLPSQGTKVFISWRGYKGGECCELLFPYLIIRGGKMPFIVARNDLEMSKSTDHKKT
jgi:hypothetical protein